MINLFINTVKPWMENPGLKPDVLRTKPESSAQIEKLLKYKFIGLGQNFGT